MNLENEKCVMVLADDLPAGVAANTAGLLGVTLGKQVPQAVGPDVCDGAGRRHLGILAVPIPVLKASREALRSLRSRLYEPEFAGLVTVDFPDAAQRCNTYGDWEQEAAQSRELTYLGIGICGDKRLVSRLTGSLPLLR